jgi:hypothetical protein
MLAEIWMQTADPQAVTSAANQIDRILRDFPEQGDAFGPDWRLVREPLVVYYTISPMDRLVRVTSVFINP